MILSSSPARGPRPVPSAPVHTGDNDTEHARTHFQCPKLCSQSSMHMDPFRPCEYPHFTDKETEHGQAEPQHPRCRVCVQSQKRVWSKKPVQWGQAHPSSNFKKNLHPTDEIEFLGLSWAHTDGGTPNRRSVCREPDSGRVAPSHHCPPGLCAVTETL